MKFDIFKWQEVKTNETYERKSGMLRVMCSKQAAIFIEAQGVEVLAGVGHDITVKISEPFTYRIEADKGARAFVESPMSQSKRTTGEVFTNLDRKPEESGSVLAVQQALRSFHLEQREVMGNLRAERRKLESLKKTVQADPKPEPKEPEKEDVKKDEDTED